MRLPIMSVLLLATGLAMAAACVPPETMQRDAEHAGHQWATEMGIADAKVMCVGADSDQDGYVSCTVREVGGWMNTIKCRYQQPIQFYTQSGCKLNPFANINSQ